MTTTDDEADGADCSDQAAMATIPLSRPFALLLASFAIFFSAFSRAQQTPHEDPYGERSILLDIKNQWLSPPPLAAWSPASALSHCSWTAVTCDAGGRVISLDFSNFNITVAVPAAICNLTALAHLDLSFNLLPGGFPVDLYRCASLRFLDLSQNNFVGVIPDDVDRLSAELQYLSLSNNNFTGDVPAAIGQLTELEALLLDDNLFNGSYPPELGKLSKLKNLTMAYNSFAPAAIPSEFGGLLSLRYLWMRQMNVVGELPPTLSKISKLEHLDLAMNRINGSIPSWIWQLEILSELYLFANSFSGVIDVGGREISARGLTSIDLSENELSGPIPPQFGDLANLTSLVLYFNRLSGVIPASIGRLPKLTDVRLFNNELSGPLPPELGKHSPLYNFEVSNNQLSGELPEFLCARNVLSNIVAFNNSLSGELPASIADCFTLDDIQIYNNSFSGEFPVKLWTEAPKLTTVLIHDNDFSGELPPVLLGNLSRIEMSNNRFTGAVPTGAVNLLVFIAANNTFSGELPRNLSQLSKLGTLNLANNRIGGNIPDGLSGLTSLSTLDLSGNQLTGDIPASLGSLPVLKWLDLSRNDLSGEIPATFDMPVFNFLNLSNNNLVGVVPSSLQNAAYANSFRGNPGLCAIAEPCNQRHQRRDLVSSVLIYLFLALAGVALLGAAVVGFLMIRRRRWQPDNAKLSSGSWKLTSFHRLEFAEHDLVGALNEDNLIGSGGSGKVYRIHLGESFQGSKVVAVKKLSGGRRDEKSEKQFEAEVKVLGSIRHTNIVKLLCCVSSDDSRMLVYEYMENSSLDGWLHNAAAQLDWPTRLGIAVDAARGLCYMHHDCSPPVVHRDVKSSNILLDSEFRAKIADFGLARILSKVGEPETVSVVAGSFGYIAPEYGKVRKINEKIDIYSFGVVLLELTTGRGPKEGDEHTSLAEWVWRHFEEGGKMSDIIDANIRDPDYLDEIDVVLGLGVRCTAPVPSCRPTMKEVVKQLVDRTSAAKQSGRGEYDVEPLLTSKRGSRRRSMSDVGEDDGDDDSGSFFVRVV